MATTKNSILRFTRQLELYQNFIVPSSVSTTDLSNTLETWDQIPKYFTSRRLQSKLRDDNGNLPAVEHKFKIGDQWHQVSFEAVKINENGVSRQYLLGPPEELVEEALRRLSTITGIGFIDETGLGARFTLYGLQKELASKGHSFSYKQIVAALEILRATVLRFGTYTPDGSLELTSRQNVLIELKSVTRRKWADDPSSAWKIVFSPMVTNAIRSLGYRQIDYGTLMSHKSQLSRWLHKRLSSNYRQASMAYPYSIKMSSIERDSGLLNLSRQHEKIRKLQSVFAELKKANIILSAKITTERGTRRGSNRSIIDAFIVISPTREFASLTTAQNKRTNDHQTALELLPPVRP